MTAPIIPGLRQSTPKDLTSPPASPRPARTETPSGNSPAAQNHVRTSTGDLDALKNIKDVPPADHLKNFGDGTPLPPNSVDEGESNHDGTAPAETEAGPTQASTGGNNDQARKSSLVNAGALPKYVEQALSSIPFGSEAQLLGFSRMREIGASLADAQKYALEDIPLVGGKSKQQATLDYFFWRTAGLSKADAQHGTKDDRIKFRAAYFEEAANLVNAARDPLVKVNYCVLRAVGGGMENAKAWANIGPGACVIYLTHDYKELDELYLDQAGLDLSPGLYPLFFGQSIPPPEWEKNHIRQRRHQRS
jgi:hypothetical protein